MRQKKLIHIYKPNTFVYIYVFVLHIYYFDNRCPYYVALVFSRCGQWTTAYLAVLIIGVIANI